MKSNLSGMTLTSQKGNMEMSNDREPNNTVCKYCGSRSYGKSCPFGPEGLHVHTPDGHHCIYCGSTAVGYGCPHNPNRQRPTHEK